MSTWPLTCQQSVCKRCHGDKHLSEFLPTRWRQKINWHRHVCVRSVRIRLRLRVTYLACRTRAKMPAASGALAEVPVCISVQPLRRSVVTWHIHTPTLSLAALSEFHTVMPTVIHQSVNCILRYEYTYHVHSNFLKAILSRKSATLISIILGSPNFKSKSTNVQRYLWPCRIRLNSSHLIERKGGQ